jgi:hypothetical protein
MAQAIMKIPVGHPMVCGWHLHQAEMADGIFML